MQNWDKWIMLILIIAVLFILFRMNKVMASQTNLMMGMAHHMGVAGLPPPQTVTDKKQKTASPPETNQPATETKEDSDEIVRIAEKLAHGKSLNRKEKEFQDRFKAQIEEEMGYSIEEELIRIATELKKDGAEVTQDDMDFYRQHIHAFKERLDATMVIDFDVQKITVKPSQEKRKPEALDEAGKKHLILSFFDDNIPKSLTSLAKLYADKTGFALSTGNTAKLLDKLLEEKKLHNEKRLYQSRHVVMFGLPHWFEKNKLKKEFIKNLK